MRLISARVCGLGRLVDTKVNLDSKVIAVVGPNEAGKSTLLRALEYLSSDQDSIPESERSRAVDVNDETQTIRADFALDEDDISALGDLDLLQQPTRVAFARRARGGPVLVDITPRPLKSPASLQRALSVLRAALDGDAWNKWIDPETSYADDEGDASRNFGAELRKVADEIEALIADPARTPDVDVPDAVEALTTGVADEPDSEPMRGALATIAEWVQRADPGVSASGTLWSRAPAFIQFGEQDRALRSSYAFDAALVQDTPLALANLAGTAQLDLDELLRVFGDVGRRGTLIMRANKQLGDVFRNAWKQSALAVRFEIDGNQLRVNLLENNETVTVFGERSAGLRMFVALIAFLKVQGTTRPPVLLIDEAENHLHLDAQADLVNMFVQQERATKVVYTTHSPACLPPDLGTGIRAVVPRSSNHQISDVQNSFWHAGPGFSALMVAMGAAAAAFTPARRAVLTEGATEMIVLPTLLRLATGLSEMPYQIAPGLSEAPARLLPQLDLEAARVAYLVDGDTGGRELAQSLVANGVPPASIYELEVPGVENLLDPEAYRTAFTALLRECNPTLDKLPTVPAISAAARDSSWAKALESWAATKELRVPSKVAVANWLVDNGAAALSAEGEQMLKSLHERMTEILSPTDHN